ncbi:MAG: glycosyltransferase family 9 protein [Melioribacteraceae bacterium]|nr:glycosyltransferase family 9 protein [Melioribacteraceae bacterium]
MKAEKVNRILIIRLSSLGDVLLTSPVIRVLKQQYPDTMIDFFVRTEYADAVKFNPNLNVVYTLPRSEKSKFILKILKDNNYDFIVDLQNNFRSRLFTKSLNKTTYSYRKSTWDKYLLVRFKINRFKSVKSITQRYADSIPGLKLDNAGLELFAPSDLESVLTTSDNYIGICPGAKHFTKRWLPEYFVELGNKLHEKGFKILLFGGLEDKFVCELISSQIQGSVNLCNDNQLFSTLSEMKNCRLIICNDSGLMHTAAAVGVPIVTIFGSSVKEFGFAPYGVPNLILENNSLSCRPCSHIGRSSCPKKHFKCMKEITPETVIASVLKLLSKL